MSPRKARPILERFWERVDTSGSCWGWTGPKSKDGYGHMKIQDRDKYAHRLSYELANGPIPDGMYIDHICHNRICVNPQHLRLATPKQNQENRHSAQSNSRSGVRGVFWFKRSGKWKVIVKHHDKQYYGGYFTHLHEAESAAIALRNRLYTHNHIDRAT